MEEEEFTSEAVFLCSLLCQYSTHIHTHTYTDIMTLPLRTRSIPQCLACLRSYAWVDAVPTQTTGLRQQIRGKKKMPKPTGDIPARLRKDLPGFGKKGQLMYTLFVYRTELMEANRIHSANGSWYDEKPLFSITNRRLRNDVRTTHPPSPEYSH